MLPRCAALALPDIHTSATKTPMVSSLNCLPAWRTVRDVLRRDRLSIPVLRLGLSLLLLGVLRLGLRLLLIGLRLLLLHRCCG